MPLISKKPNKVPRGVLTKSDFTLLSPQNIRQNKKPLSIKGIYNADNTRKYIRI